MRRVSGKNTAWTPGESDIVCSEHFVDGPLTVEHSDPTWNLRYIAGVKKHRKSWFVKLSFQQLSLLKNL